MVAPGIIPCIWLDDEAEAAAALYARVFGARILGTSRYPEGADNPSGRPRGSILTVEVDVMGRAFTLLNGGPAFRPNPTISFFVGTPSAEETDSIAHALAKDGGMFLMEPGTYPWSPRYAWVQDQYGVSWQIMQTEAFPRPTPCLMFAGGVHGRAAEALEAYVRAFAGGSRILALERYSKDEGPEGTVKHGRASLDGDELVAMDSHVVHDAAFSEALSLQVTCKDQAEVDRLWDALVDGGGEHGPCGWLKDRFGVSWQVVPEGVAHMMTSPDAAARDRAFAAMLQMQKLDVKTLEAAFAGR